MTHHDEDRRVIEEDAPEYNATLVRRVDHTADLASFWVELDGNPVPFEAGPEVRDIEHARRTAAGYPPRGVGI